VNNTISEIHRKIEEADAILIAASNGLSISEGYHLFADNEAFQELFPEIRLKYGIRCLLQGMSCDYESEEEKWSFWSRLITKYIHEYQVSPQMKNLKRLVSDKPYFIITSNGETHFEKAGFDENCIYEVEGNLANMQCERACHHKLYPVNEIVENMVKHEKDGRIPTELLPKCPLCGGNMQMNYEVFPGFIRNEDAAERYMSFIDEYQNKKLVILELGIGMRNQLIKAPIMRMVASLSKCTYITVNKGEIYIPEQIKDKSYGLDGDITEILEDFCGHF
jgi:NAD-dependent SIR2 family protein deacetylase